jgi:hypothetical protein
MQDTSKKMPQDGSPIDRDVWLGAWPVSKRDNEWVRAFGLTYTLIECLVPDLGYSSVSHYHLTVVGPGGVRFDRDCDSEMSADAVKEWLWPESSDHPFDIEELRLEQEET